MKGQRQPKTGEALRESEERFSIVFRKCPISMSISRPADGLLVDVNAAFCQMYGYAREELLGRTSLELGLWPDATERARLVAMVQLQGRVQQFEARFRRKSGDLGHLFVSADLIVLYGQQHLLGIQTDITQRKLAETALRESEDRFRTLAEASFEGIVITEAGKIVDCNQQLSQILGYSRDELRGKNVTQCVVPEDHERVLKSIFRGAESVTEQGVIRKDGEVIRVESHGKTIWSEGRAIRLTAIRDITASKRAEETLRRYELLATQSRDIILFIRRDDGRLLEANAAAEIAYGYSRAELLNLRIHDLRAPDVQAITDHQIAEVDGHDLFFESLHLRKDGSTFPVEVSSHAATVGGTRILFSIVRDISERKRAEREKLEIECRLLQAQKLESIGILAGGIAHDFNNILSAILGYADLALLHLPVSEPACADIEVIKTAARRAADLTQQMLAYSGKGKFHVESVDLSRVVEESRKILGMSVAKNAAVTYDLAAGLPVILADAAQMCQVVMNLVINASEALGDRGGTVAVLTKAIGCNAKDLSGIGLGQELTEGLYVCLEVVDTGCGMDEPTRTRIFDPFFTTKFTGRGLGLAAVHGIVRSHKGAIQVSSGPGEGTTFRVFFPAKGPSAPAPRGEAKRTPGHSSGTILVVDDEEIVRTLAQRMIKHAGFSTLTASGGREAIQLFRQRGHEISCVLLDLTMPDLDGAETFRELRRIRPDVRVILSSGYSEEDATAQFVGQGLAGFIQKPYQLAPLIAQIERACEIST